MFVCRIFPSGKCGEGRKSRDSGRIDSIWTTMEFNVGSIFCNSRVFPSSSCVFRCLSNLDREILRTFKTP